MKGQGLLQFYVREILYMTRRTLFYSLYQRHQLSLLYAVFTSFSIFLTCCSLENTMLSFSLQFSSLKVDKQGKLQSEVLRLHATVCYQYQVYILLVIPHRTQGNNW